MKKVGLPKIECEICQFSDVAALHYHHIIPRTDPSCTNHPYNLCVICSNCHNEVHHGAIDIIGVFPAANKSGRIVVYTKNGICNVPGMEHAKPPYKPDNKSMKVFYGKNSR